MDGELDGALEANQNRRELLESLFAHVADAIFLIDADGDIIDVNPAACAMLGYIKEELLGIRAWDFVMSASSEEINHLMCGIERDVPVTIQRIFRRRTGEQGTMELRLARLGSPNKDLFVVSCRDLTEQKQLEERLRDLSERRQNEEELQRLNTELSKQTAHLREVNQTLFDSEQRLRLAIETGQIGLWVWNSSDINNSGDWSDRLKEIFGLPLDTVVTHEIFLKCVHPEDRERVDRSVMDALAGANGGEYRAEYRTIDPRDGSEHWVTARGQAFFNSQGLALRFIGTVMDTTERKHAEESMAQLNLELERRIVERTADLERINRALQAEIEERKRAEEALHRSEDYLRLAIDTIPGLVWTSLPDGDIEYLNKRWLEYTGMRQEEATGWGWQAAIHPDDLSGLLKYWKSILTAGEGGEYQARLRRFDGEYRWFLFQGVPFYDEQGKLVKWYGTNTDIEATRASQHLARGQLEALSQTLTALSRESEPEKFLEHILRTIGQQLKAHSIGVWEMNRSTGRTELIANCEDDRLHLATPQESQASQVATPPRDHPVWAEFFRSGEQLVFGEIATEPPRVRLADGPDTSWHDWMGDAVDHPQVRTMMKRLLAAGVVDTLVVPMLVGGKVVGLLSVRFREKRLFASEELELTRALAHQAMLAIQLLRLSRQSRQAAVVAERNRLARDIHDTLAQGFTGVIVQLEAAEDAQTQGLATDAAAHIERARELARESLREARRSVQALRPQALAARNLCAAMGELIAKMTAGTSLHATFRVKGQPPLLPQEWEENLLRIGQEILTNALRHARASNFQARLEFDSRTVRLEFRDDGCGFAPPGKSDGFGLRGIKERIEAMGGELTIQSAPGKGTSTVAVLRLAE